MGVFSIESPFPMGPACTAARDAYLADRTGDVAFESYGFDGTVALIKGGKALVIGDETVDGDPCFSCTVYELTGDEEEPAMELSTDGGTTVGRARKAIAEFIEAFDQDTRIVSPQRIRNGAGAWRGTLGEALSHDADRMIDWNRIFVERYDLHVSTDEDGSPTIDGDPDWWAGDHLELWTIEDVRRLLDDPNARVSCG